ncbi:hydrogenase maturation protease [Spirulina sp. CCNP1310]|uniref:hydrogenase maturation protease n=1 Tax=Spirulina sp. CCNP1310 TaxID=3110249 RepID=UPI002B21A59D|nr:hydrogenase maturation protease [Spirulina sp. CCNP1310]MEA5418013.1 hydrogenase maturation protease [Spirulina sp. CCNP1310]
MTRLLIGYGNTLRCDDGVGQAIAQTVADWQIPHLQVEACHQLTPELALTLALVERVWFIDAYAVPEPALHHPVIIQPIQADDHLTPLGHHLTPPLLLSLTKQLYGRIPEASWLLIPAGDFSFGEHFSAMTQQAMEEAIAWLETTLTPQATPCTNSA